MALSPSRRIDSYIFASLPPQATREAKAQRKKALPLTKQQQATKRIAAATNIGDIVKSVARISSLFQVRKFPHSVVYQKPIKNAPVF
jgi:hypothetical protein